MTKWLNWTEEEKRTCGLNEAMCVGGHGWQDARCTGCVPLWEAAGRSAVSGTLGKWQDLPGLLLPLRKVRGVGQLCLQTLMFWSLLGACSEEMHMGGPHCHRFCVWECTQVLTFIVTSRSRLAASSHSFADMHEASKIHVSHWSIPAKVEPAMLCLLPPAHTIDRCPSPGLFSATSLLMIPPFKMSCKGQSAILCYKCVKAVLSLQKVLRADTSHMAVVHKFKLLSVINNHMGASNKCL